MAEVHVASFRQRGGFFHLFRFFDIDDDQWNIRNEPGGGRGVVHSRQTENFAEDERHREPSDELACAGDGVGIGVAETLQGVPQHKENSDQRIALRDGENIPFCNAHDLGVDLLHKQRYHMGAAEIQRRAHQDADEKIEQQDLFDRIGDPFVILCAEILAHKRLRGDSEAAHGDVGKIFNSVCCGDARHCACAEGVDGALHTHGADRGDRELHGYRYAEFDLIRGCFEVRSEVAFCDVNVPVEP